MFFSPEFFADPYRTYRRIRDQGRLVWTDDLYGGAWLIPHYEDVVAAMREPRFTAERGHVLVAQFPPEDRGKLAEFGRIHEEWMLNLDPPQHTRLRKLMNHAFAPRALHSLRPRITGLVAALLDSMTAELNRSGSVDFMQSFAHKLPVHVIADMLGADPADQDLFLDWSDDIARFLGSAPALNLALRAQDSLTALTEYFRALLPERTEHGGDDLLSLLIRIEEQGDILTTDELLSQCSLLLFAGHEPMRNLLGNGLYLLLSRPDQRELLDRDPSLLPGAVRELARFESPVQLMGRLVAEDFEWHGQQLRAGQLVLCMVGSANHDPARYGDPDALDIARRETAHLAFGFSAHVCIGASLSYLQAELAFAELLRRLPGLRLATDAPEWKPNPLFRGLERLPIKLDQAAAAVSA